MSKFDVGKYLEEYFDGPVPEQERVLLSEQIAGLQAKVADLEVRIKDLRAQLESNLTHETKRIDACHTEEVERIDIYAARLSKDPAMRVAIAEAITKAEANRSATEGLAEAVQAQLQQELPELAKAITAYVLGRLHPYCVKQ